MKNNQSQITIQPRELHQLLREGRPGQLLDVRTPGEFAAAHVPGAKLVPLDELDAAAFGREHADKSIPIYVLCQSGGRARRAIEKLERAGVSGCVLVTGGTQAWLDAGLPVNHGESHGLPLMRQVQITIGVISATGAALAIWVHPKFAFIPLITGCGLVFAGLTGFCGLALLLAKMPWNKTGVGNSPSCCTPESK